MFITSHIRCASYWKERCSIENPGEPCDVLEESYSLGVGTPMETGVRFGEFCALRWQMQELFFLVQAKSEAQRCKCRISPNTQIGHRLWMLNVESSETFVVLIEQDSSCPYSNNLRILECRPRINGT